MRTRFGKLSTIILGSLLTIGLTFPASASFHSWAITEIFSNSDGTIQFIELSTASNGQQLLSGQDFTSDTNTYMYTGNLPSSSTGGQTFLMATAAFAAQAGAPVPDYIIPSNFFSTTADTLTLVGASTAPLSFTAGQLPTDGINSLDDTLSTAAATPKNFAGETESPLGLSGTWLFPLNSGQSTTGSVDASTGVGLAILESDGTFTLTIEHDVASPTAAHIHGPAGVGVTAGVEVVLNPAINPIVLSTTLDNSQQTDLVGGLWYVNLHTAGEPAGAIRGQIDPQTAVAKYITFAATSVQSTTGSTDPGRGIGNFNLLDDGDVTMTFTHDVPSPTAIHIHGPAGIGITGPVIFVLDHTQNPVPFSATFTPIEIQQLLDGEMYVNVHTAGDPAGAIRGQIINGGQGLSVGNTTYWVLIFVGIAFVIFVRKRKNHA